MAALFGGLLAGVGCNTPLTTSCSFVSQPTSANKGEDHARTAEVEASLMVARGLEKQGDDAGASAQYEKVVQQDPGNLTASRRLAVLHDRRGDFVKAEAEYRMLARALPRDADLFNDWGYSCYLRNNWAEAETHLQTALEIDSNNTRARCNLGLVLAHQGRYQDALQAFRAAKLSEADAHCNLAFVYWGQGKVNEARSECAVARQLDPSCAKAREMLVKFDQPAHPAGACLATAKENRAPSGVQQLGAVSPGQMLPASAGGNSSVIYRLPPGMNWVPVTPKPPRMDNSLE